MPQKTSVRSERNRAIECMKVIISCGVVVVHIPFPGTLAIFMTLISKCFLPFFLLVSGYFSYNASCATIRRRFLYILKINLLASVFYCLLNLVTAQLSGMPAEEYLSWPSILPRLPDLATWLVTHVNPMAGHLWYLTAMCFCYLFLWMYTAFWGDKPVDYRPAYIVAFMLIFLLVFVSGILHSLGVFIHYIAVRNGWVMGPGFFFAGIFLHQYEQQLIRNLGLTTKRLLLVIAGCLAIMMMRLRQFPIVEFPPEQALLGFALFLLCIVHPQLPIRSAWLDRITLRLSPLYTGIYILHPAVGSFYTACCKPWVASLLGRWEGYCTPLIALAITIALVLIFDTLKRMVTSPGTKHIPNRSGK